MGQGKKTNKISEGVASRVAAADLVSATELLSKARLQAEAAATDAQRAKQEATRSAPAVQPQVAEGGEDSEASKTANATAKMRDAATFAFSKAMAEGVTKEEAKARALLPMAARGCRPPDLLLVSQVIARKAGKAAYRLALRDSEPADEDDVSQTTVQAALPGASSDQLGSGAGLHDEAGTSDVGGGQFLASPFLKAQLSAEEKAERAQQKAQEMLERANRLAHEVETAKRKTSKRGNRL
jgi:hypothetical protein